MVTRKSSGRKVSRSRKQVDTDSSMNIKIPTAAVGGAMMLLTNYQNEIKALLVTLINTPK